MIQAEAQNVVNDYINLGFDINLRKLSDDYYEGADKNTGVITSLDADRQIESVSANKLTTNDLKQIVNIGNVKLDGTKGSIEVRDKQGKLIVILGNY